MKLKAVLRNSGFLGSLALAFGLATMAGLPALAQEQQAQIKAGTLTCQGQGGVGLILGSKEKLSCTFSPSSGGPKRYFNGTITRVGLDVGVRGKSVMIWAVLGSTEQMAGEQLGGTFAGVSADVAAGIGAGANVLVGGNKKSVTLQPLSVSGGTGVNLAIGVSGLKLVPVSR